MSGSTEANTGRLSDKEYQLIRELTPLPHVDLVILRKGEDGGWETLVFNRKIGPTAGKTCLIGGRQLKGETIQDTITRQRAEVGLHVKVIQPFQHDFPSFVDSSEDQDSLKQATTLTYPVEIIGEMGEPKSDEVDSPRWVDPQDLPQNIPQHYIRKISETINRLNKLSGTFI